MTIVQFPKNLYQHFRFVIVLRWEGGNVAALSRMTCSVRVMFSLFP